MDEKSGSNVVDVGVDLSEFYMSVEWDILEVPAVRNEKFYTCCDEPYLDITFNITMRRKTLFYTVNIIIPCMGISFLTVLTFYLPSDSGEKNGGGGGGGVLFIPDIRQDPIYRHALHFHSHQSSRVFPAGRRDHSTYVAGRAAAWKVPDIRHDTRFDKVSVPDILEATQIAICYRR
ncbi:Acetylcholine receptor subunit alpha [Apis cerana cerana]|uniref:Acetylcholine receptor subunit alpha n=1 Tax=Apis cerana cerana TaxID=94128 RepID=A0A2A3E883_APICC|nr:Acetylcholine receptor subunit alpha [Apis cerana cerana]